MHHAALLLALFSPAQQLLDLDSDPPIFPENRERGTDHNVAGRVGADLILGARIYRTQGDFEDLDRNVLIASDGTLAGTRVIAELDAPGSDFNLSSSESAALPNGDLVLQLVSEPVGAEAFLLDAATLEVRLLADVLPGAQGSRARSFTAWGGRVWFRADGPSGPEIWSTDGSPAGTVRSELPLASPGSAIEPVAAGANLFVVGDTGRLLARQQLGGGWTQIRPPAGGAFEDFPNRLGTVGDRVLLPAFDPVSGVEPWACDGTQAGLLLLADIEPGPAGLAPTPLAENGAQVLFRGDSPANGQEPWVSDGTPAGTFLLFDLQGGAGSGLANFPGPSAAGAPGGFYFSGSNGVEGAELWFTDGTTAGTAMVADLMPGSLGSDPLQFVFDGGALHFTASDDPVNFERRVFRQDLGTPGIALQSTAAQARPLGVTQGRLLLQEGFFSTGRLLGNAGSPTSEAPLLDADPVPSTGSSSPEAFARIDFRGCVTATTSAAGLEPFLFDPATLAFSDALHVGPGANGSAPRLLGETPAGPLFVQADGLGAELHVGAPGPPLIDLAPGPASATIRGGAPIRGRVLFHVAEPATQRGLWSSDGTAAGTLRLVDSDAPAIDFAPGSWTRVAGRIWFAFDGELWHSDGESAAPAGLGGLDPLPGDARVARAGGRVVFETGGPSHAARLWSFAPGAPAATELLTLGQIGDPEGVTLVASLEERALFAFTSDAVGEEVWSTDGTPAGTLLLIDAIPGTGGRVLDLAAAPPLGFFLSAESAALPPVLWSTDGTPAGTGIASRGDLDVGGLVASSLTALGRGRVGFRGLDPRAGHEPWISDGTPAGTGPLADLQPGPRSSYPGPLLRIGGHVLVAGFDLVHGREPFAVPLAGLDLAAADPVGVGSGARLRLTDGHPAPSESVTFLVDELDAGVAASLLFSSATTLLPLGGPSVQYLAAPKLLGTGLSDGQGQLAFDVLLAVAPSLAGSQVALQALAVSIGGPLFGLFEVSRGLDLVLGE